MSWMSSYILILLVPLIIIAFCYFEAVNVIESEISKAHSASLQQIQQSIDNRLKSVEELIYQVGRNEKNKSIMYLKGDVNPINTFNLINLINDLATYKSANEFIDDFFVYYSNNDFIVSGLGKYNTQEYYKFNYEYKGISYADWLNIIKEKHVKEYKPYVRRTNTGEIHNCIMYLQTLPLENIDSLKATAAILIDEDTINKKLKDLKWISAGDVLIIDNNNRIISSTSNKQLPKEVSYDKLSKYDGNFNATIGGESFVISYVSSEVNNWKYISIVPTKIFLQKAKYIRNITYGSICICVLLGIFIAFIFTKRNYNPIKALIQTIKSRSNNIPEEKYAGYDFIEQSILKIIDEREKVYEKLDTQKYIIRNSFLCRLIKGFIKDKDLIQQECEVNNIRFTSSDFTVMLFYIEDTSNEFFEKCINNTEDILKIVRVITDSTIYEIIGQKNNGYIFGIDEMVGIILNTNEEDKDKLKDEVISIGNKTIDYIQNNYGIYFSAAISDVHEKLEGISEAYIEALEVIEYKNLLGGRQIIHYDDIKKINLKQYNYQYSIDEENQIINFIKDGDFENAKNVMDRIFEKHFDEASISSQMIKCRTLGIINIMFHVMDELSIVCDKGFLDSLEIVENLTKCKTTRALKREIYNIFDKVNMYIGYKKGEEVETIKSKAIRFIEENYKDPNLNVLMIANYLKISEVYLSRAFKKQSGVGLLEFIHKVRIERAKQLMKNKKLNVKDIAEQTGYYNSTAFIRTFKKFEGITPGKYMDI